MGRFLNADAFASTGQGILGNNMIAYCLNNPVNYADTNGKDAVWIQEESNVGTMGHSGLLIQDKSGQWYYFFWGMGATLGSTRYYLIEVSVDNLNLNNTEDVITAVESALSQINDLGEKTEEFRATRKNITASLYFEGDYSATYSYLVQLGEDVASGHENYNVFTNNCGQVSWRAMSKSDVRFTMTSVSTIPNVSYVEIVMFANKTPEEYRNYLQPRSIAGS